MKTNSIKQQKEFEKLCLTGKYTQKEMAQMIGVSRQTAVRWVKDMQVLKYFTVRKNLAKELERLSKSGYKDNADTISRLITDIERIDGLIRKAKYIPHLTNK